ncbi:hypothetical protein TNCV_1308961 [Trichonephila clavipes]|nr:hypothetical protein TNCV_1308961 [Trichonephila clavipes]
MNTTTLRCWQEWMEHDHTEHQEKKDRLIIMTKCVDRDDHLIDFHSTSFTFSTTHHTVLLGLQGPSTSDLMNRAKQVIVGNEPTALYR